MGMISEIIIHFITCIEGPKVELLPLDIEIDKTLRKLKKVRAVEEAVMAEHKEGNQKILIIETDRPQQR